MPNNSAPPPAAPLWSQPMDLLLGAGGLSIPLMLLVPAILTRLGDSALLLFPTLALFCNYPHYWATLERAFGSEAAWREKRGVLVGGTGLMLAGLLVVLAWPSLLPPIFTLYLMWSPWHYAGQNYGLVLLLARRSGIQATSAEMHQLKASFWLSTGIAWIFLHRQGAGAAILWGLELDRTLAARAGLVLLAGQAVLLQRVLSRWLSRCHIRELAAPLLLLLSQVLWFSGFAVTMRFPDLTWLPQHLGAGEVALMHCAQYLWVIYYFNNLHISTNKIYVYKKIFSWILGGILLWIALPWGLSLGFSLDFQRTLLTVTAFINLHHFLVDGVIWKLREPRIQARLGLGAPPEHPSSMGFNPTEGKASGGLRGRPFQLLGLLLGAGCLLGLTGLDLLYRRSLSRLEQPEARALALTINPHHSSLATSEGLFLRGRGEREEGLALLRVAISLDPLNATAWHNLGTALASMPDRSGDAEAERAFLKATALEGKLFEAWLGLAIVAGRSEQNGSQARALDALDRAETLRPESDMPDRIRNRLLFHASPPPRPSDMHLPP